MALTGGSRVTRRRTVREYSEELLGAPEHDDTRTEPIDYPSWPLYQRLEQARQDGTLRASLLGVGLDALTLAATILTVVVIDDDVFNEAFGNAVQFNEGTSWSASATAGRPKVCPSPARRSTGCCRRSRWPPLVRHAWRSPDSIETPCLDEASLKRRNGRR
jgi:hypothetical protein